MKSRGYVHRSGQNKILRTEPKGGVQVSDIILEMSQITKIYDNGIVANRNVDFSLRAGEIHALVGENGAGKTTLMKILFGMERPSSGKIFLNGKELDMHSSKDAIANGIGMVHQHFMLVDSFTVAQNITLGIEPRRGPLADIKKAVEFTNRLSEKYNLPIDATARVGNLSVGIKQKIEILKALARGARILILDEPTAVLTPQETDRLFDELLALSGQGHTIVFISHKIREVKKISKRVTIMRDSYCMGVFDTDSITEQEISQKIVGWNNTDTETAKTPKKKSSVKIKVRNLTIKGVGDVPVLDDVSFDVRGGTILGVVGVQGNGQVELVEMLTGSRTPDKGSIYINSSDISGFSMRQLRDSGCGFIPEDRLHQGVAVSVNIMENIISNQYSKPPFCRRGLLNKKMIDEFSDKCIAEYEIKCDGRATKISMLSGGNMQKVVAARECSTNPDVLIAEQPTRGVDVGAARAIHKKILSLRDEGCAVLLISADLSEIMRICDSLIVMYEGRIVAFFEDVSVITEEELGLCMLGIERHSRERIWGTVYD